MNSNFKKKAAAVALAVALAAGTVAATASTVDDGAANSVKRVAQKANSV